MMNMMCYGLVCLDSDDLLTFSLFFHVVDRVSPLHLLPLFF